MSTDKFTSFIQMFDRILKNIKKIETAYMRSYGLRGVHTTCLLCLGKHPEGLTVTQLASECGIDKALSSRVVRELFMNAYLAFSSDSENKKYNKKYVLTEKSKKVIIGLSCAISEYVSEANRNISKEKLAVFYSVLNELESNIDGMTKRIAQTGLNV